MHVGDYVSYEVGPKENRKRMAVNIQPTRLFGIVTSANRKKHFGFIACPEITGELYFRFEEVSPKGMIPLPGHSVSFVPAKDLSAVKVLLLPPPEDDPSYPEIGPGADHASETNPVPEASPPSGDATPQRGTGQSFPPPFLYNNNTDNDNTYDSINNAVETKAGSDGDENSSDYRAADARHLKAALSNSEKQKQRSYREHFKDIDTGSSGAAAGEADDEMDPVPSAQYGVSPWSNPSDRSPTATEKELNKLLASGVIHEDEDGDVHDSDESNSVGDQSVRSEPIKDLRRKTTMGTRIVHPLDIRTTKDSKLPGRVEADTEAGYVYVQDGLIEEESRTAEFKAVTHSKVPDARISLLADKNICAFINSRQGGTIFFGVRDDGVIVGIELPRSVRDSIRLKIDYCISKFKPVPSSAYYQINFVPVISRNSLEIVTNALQNMAPNQRVNKDDPGYGEFSRETLLQLKGHSAHSPLLTSTDAGGSAMGKLSPRVSRAVSLPQVSMEQDLYIVEVRVTCGWRQSPCFVGSDGLPWRRYDASVRMMQVDEIVHRAQTHQQQISTRNQLMRKKSLSNMLQDHEDHVIQRIAADIAREVREGVKEELQLMLPKLAAGNLTPESKTDPNLNTNTNTNAEEASRKIEEACPARVGVLVDPLVPTNLRPLMDPLSLEVMVDPVVAKDGLTYERKIIENFFRVQRKAQHHHSKRNGPYIFTSPCTGLQIEDDQLIPNRNIKELIDQYMGLRPTANRFSSLSQTASLQSDLMKYLPAESTSSSDDDDGEWEEA